MGASRISVWSALALVLCLTIFATRMSAAQQPADYVLGADDVIEVTVTDQPDLGKVVTILPDGKVTLPEVGELHAAGKTPRALAAEIQNGLERTRNNVSVLVSVREVHSRRVRIVGAVRAAGAFDLKPSWRLMDVIAMAGGLTARPTHVTGRLIRRGGVILTLDLVKAMAEPDGDDNVTLQTDDLILLDEKDVSNSQVHVLGEVSRPGAIELEDKTTLVSLLSLAGGPAPRAALGRAYVLRASVRHPVNLASVLDKGQPDPEAERFKLQPGDVLVIPANETLYAVLGQVARPGYYPIPEKEGVTVLQAFSVGGGQLANADLKRAGVIRQQNGKSVMIPINIQQMLRKADLASNFKLQENDILYIPEHGGRGLYWQDLLTPFSVLSFLGLRVFH